MIVENARILSKDRYKNREFRRRITGKTANFVKGSHKTQFSSNGRGKRKFRHRIAEKTQILPKVHEIEKVQFFFMAERVLCLYVGNNFLERIFCYYNKKLFRPNVKAIWDYNKMILRATD